MMKTRKGTSLAMLALMAVLAASWGLAGCGGKSHPDEDGDAGADGDGVTDGEGITDGQEDIHGEGDVPVDGDVTEGEVTPPAPPQAFETESAGGAKISSEHYKLEIFVAPARPVGSGSSTNYKVKLGPGGVLGD